MNKEKYIIISKTVSVPLSVRINRGYKPRDLTVIKY
jgi:hypothetical protein